MKNILIVSHSPFPSNSSIHVHYFANELIKLGLDCVVAVPHDKNSIFTLKDNLYAVTQYDEINKLTELFSDRQSPDLVHAWTPREHVRKYCYALSTKYEFKLVIHLEDNEESIIERFVGRSLDNWLAKYDALIPYNLSHPVKYREFMETADGVTTIIEKLQEFVPCSTSTMTLYPGVDREQFYRQPKNSNLLKSLGLDNGTTVLCYTGNVHLANIDEVRSLYLAVGKRNQAGSPTVLLRTGVNNNLQILNKKQSWVKKYIIELGWVEREKIPEILALADILVQPGRADEFNDYRFPSKIPEFLAMGKPVIIPNSNIAKILTHKENAIILDLVDENSLPSAIDLIVDNSDLTHTLAENALTFAQHHLSWSNSAKKLYSFYNSLFVKEKEVSALRNALKRTKFYCNEFLQSKLIEKEQLITAMMTSKFWKIRSIWFKIKNSLGIKDE